MDELGWQLHPSCDFEHWDGLTHWFLQQAVFRIEVKESPTSSNGRVLRVSPK